MKKTNLWKRFVLIDALVVLSVVSVFAWFYMGDIANVESLTESVADAGYIKISEDDGKTWENGLNIDLGEAGFIREMSGNGAELFEPVYGVDIVDGSGITEVIEGYTPVTSSEYYIERTFTFETDTVQQVYLTNESYISPANPLGNISNMGNFSRDYIAGAIRVAFFSVGDDGDEELIYIWAPNPRIQFANNTVTKNGNVEESYFYMAGTENDDIIEIPTSGKADGISDDGKFVWGNPEQAEISPLLDFDGSGSAPYRESIKVRIWLEGTDRECVKELHSGKFKMYFSFNKPVKE